MSLKQGGKLVITDLSNSEKAGLKGSRAASWLEECGIPVPAAPNTWLPLSEEGLIARLGESEFLLDGGEACDVPSRIRTLLQNPPARVYPILRQDAVIALTGGRLNEVLLETCSIDFSSLATTQIVLTSMVGVPVIAIPVQRNGISAVTIWVDPTFGRYLWRTLLGIVSELEGGLADNLAHETTTEEAQ